ncbi:MAG: nucleotide-binding universal stress UspA family protein, partial [Halovenus sp.]
RFEQQGIRTEWSLIFDHDRVEARHQIARDDGADAVLLPGGANTLGKVLVAARRTQNVEKKMSTLLNTVDRDDLISLDLIHIADETVPEGEKEGKRILTEMKSVLEELGVPSVQIEQEVRTGDDVAFELNRASRDYDLLVLGETEQDIGDKIFGPVAEYVVDDRDVPVLITR